MLSSNPHPRQKTMYVDLRKLVEQSSLPRHLADRLGRAATIDSTLPP